MSRPVINNRLPQFVQSVRARSERGMTQVLILGASEAASMTPIDSSALINSQFRKVETPGTKVVGTVGYTAEYAMAIHAMDDSGKGKPRPMRNGRSNGVTWGPAGETEFLKKGFEQAEPNIRAVLFGSIRT